jgi:integrase
VITGARRGELCALQIRDIDLDNGVVHIAFSYVVKGGRKLRKDTKTHQDRSIAIDPVTCALIQETLDEMAAVLAEVGVSVPAGAYLFSNDPAHARPWNPDWVTRRVGDLVRAAQVSLDIKTARRHRPGRGLRPAAGLRPQPQPAPDRFARAAVDGTPDRAAWAPPARPVPC